MAKVAVVTGASRGIGAQIAKTLAKQNYSVAVCCKNNKQKAQEVVDEIIKNGGTAALFVADVSQEDDVTNLFNQIEDLLGKVNLLVNNAGIAQQKLFTDITLHDWDTMLNTNLRSAFLCSKAVLPYMVSQKKRQNN